MATAASPIYDLTQLPEIWDWNQKQQWLVDGILIKNSVTLLTGESGCGKSTFALLLAYAVARGESFLGRDTEKTPVLFVDKENNVTVYIERFERFGMEKTPEMRFWGQWNTELEPQPPNSRVILNFVELYKPLIIYDSLIAFHPGSEQDSTETRAYMDWFRKLSNRGATILIIHHVGKGENTTKYRGSSDIKASVDMAWLLTQKKRMLKHLVLQNFKTREGEAEDIDFGLEGQKFVLMDKAFVEKDDPQLLKVVETVFQNPGRNQQELIKLLPLMAIHKVRKLLMVAETLRLVSTQPGPKNATFYYPAVKQNGGMTVSTADS